MIRLIAAKILQVLFVLWLATTLAFFAFHLTPGDPAQTLLAASGAGPEEIARRRAELGLDDPILVQYVRYLADLARGNLGTSWLQSRSVGRIVLEQLPATAELALAAILIGTGVGLTLGFLAALYQGTWVDTLATAIATIGIATPTFWSGLLAILFFSLYLRWFPSSGAGGLRYLVLPASVLGFALSGSIARMVRARVADILRAPYILAVRARGLSPWRILFVHVLRPAAGPVITVLALQLGFLLGGAAVTEAIFARPGLGRLTVQAIISRDLPIVRGTVLVSAVAYLLASTLADLVRLWLDPRLRELEERS